MATKKIVIVGGVAGGASAAARLRRLDERAHIVMIERGEYISFANCGLPYYIGGSIQDRDKLLVQTVAGMSDRFKLDIRIRSEVTSIDREQKGVWVRNLLTGELYLESYDTLILSPGAKPIAPPIPGLPEAQHVFYLRNIPDTDLIKGFVNNVKPEKAVVVGGGFIGLEMAENLHELGIQVSLVERLPQVMEPLDFEMAALVQQHMRQKGVALHLNDGLQEIRNQGKTLLLQSGTELATDMIIMAAGVQPESNLAQEAGLTTGHRKSIVVNEYMQTSDPDIYAVGDAIEVKDYINGQAAFVPLAWPANRQGRIVADNIAGRKTPYKGTLGTAIAKVFDLTAATTGNNEKTLNKLNIPYEVTHIHPNSHAGYYPGAKAMALKLLFSPENGSILGAQAVGEKGVDKRIDVLATAIKAGLTVYDLPDLELAYAPPYSSAKDPVNMVGYVAQNLLEGQVHTYQWHEMDGLIANGHYVVDVREKSEFDAGFVAGAVNIPLHQLRDRLSELPENQTIYVYCQAGLRGYIGLRILAENNYDVKSLDGGYKTYSVAKKEQACTEAKQQVLCS